jgi:hypothetical protein
MLSARTRCAVTGYNLQAVKAEVLNENVTVAGQGQAVGQRAAQVPRGLAGGLREGGRPLLGDGLLRAVGRDLQHSAPGAGCPERAVTLRQNALGPLEIVPDVPDGRRIQLEVQARITRCTIPRTTQPENPLRIKRYVERSEAGAKKQTTFIS